MRQPLIACCLIVASAQPAPLLSAKPSMGAADNRAITAAVGDSRRTPANVARDQFRHPAETLAFFGIRPDMTVVDVLPGSGWYSEILAPMLQEKGRYIAAAAPAGRGRDATMAMIAGDPARYGKVVVTSFDPKTPSTIAPPGTADAVLIFREVHNFLAPDGTIDGRAFADCYAALKPGGVLGIEEHRLPEDRPAGQEGKSGYVKPSTVIRLATAAGFTLAGKSEVNANPKDHADYPGGVWTLPPSLQLKDQDRDRYLAIGESDRMTLKFVKPRA